MDYFYVHMDYFYDHFMNFLTRQSFDVFLKEGHKSQVLLKIT